MAFTLVFGGDIRSFKANPLTAETPFGTAHSAGIGDEFEKSQIFREALEEISRGTGNAADLARKALDEAQAIAKREFKAA